MASDLSGWYPAPAPEEFVLFDVLFIDGESCATVMAFEDDGPWYASATTPQGQTRRLGAGASPEGAIAWAERITGYRPTPTRTTSDA